MVFLSETKSSVAKMNSLKFNLRLDNFFAVGSRGMSRGIALQWSNKIEVTERSFSSNHIDCNMN